MGTDKIAYRSRLARVKASNKLAFGGGLLLVCLAFGSDSVSALTLLLASAATLLLGGVSFKSYLKLLLAPLYFLLAGAAAVAVTSFASREQAVFALPVAGVYIGVSAATLRTSLSLFLKAMGAISCLYFIALTTPLNSLLSFFRRRLPPLVVDLSELIYRFVFILADEAKRIYTAQAARLGYSGFSSSISSLGGLVSSVFIRALKRAERVGQALESRGFDGNFDLLAEKEATSRPLIALAAASCAALTAIGVLERLNG